MLVLLSGGPYLGNKRPVLDNFFLENYWGVFRPLFFFKKRVFSQNFSELNFWNNDSKDMIVFSHFDQIILIFLTKTVISFLIKNCNIFFNIVPKIWFKNLPYIK